MLEETLAISELIQAVAAADSAGALIEAVRSLAAARSSAAITTLITVLGFNNPGAAVAAVDGLVYGARAWAIRALAMIGDPRALEVLLDTARGELGEFSGAHEVAIALSRHASALIEGPHH
jgi:phycocyanobilin lyase beta subunit